MDKSQFTNYIDGVVKICKKKKQKTDFNVQMNATSYEDLELIEKLNYKELSKRVQDFEFAKQNKFTLSMKIQVRKVKGITSKHCAVIDNFLYSIKYIDEDKTSLYLYLEGERSVK